VRLFLEEQDWDETIARAQQVLALNPNMPPAAFLVGRARELAATEPEDSGIPPALVAGVATLAAAVAVGSLLWARRRRRAQAKQPAPSDDQLP